MDRPLIAGSEILTNPWRDYFGSWKPSNGVNTKGYDARKSTAKEIKRFASWYGGVQVGIEQGQTVQMTAIFEIPEDALPVQAEVIGFDRPLTFD